MDRTIVCGRRPWLEGVARGAFHGGKELQMRVKRNSEINGGKYLNRNFKNEIISLFLTNEWERERGRERNGLSDRFKFLRFSQRK